MICIICKQAELQEGTGSSLFERNGMTLVIKNVPKLICPNCGEVYTDEETTERLLQIAAQFKGEAGSAADALEVADRVRSLIQRKIDGEEITASDVEEPRAQVIDLMEALKASLGGARPKAASSPSRMPIKAEAKRKPAKPAKLAARKNSAKRASR